EPNLHTDQRLVVEKISYKLHAPRRGDVVVLKVREGAHELLIKRVIGLPGETVEIRNGRVFVDGAALDEPYLAQPTRGHYGPVYIPPLHLFVLGDNRGASNDSRSFGPIAMKNVVGRAWFSYWPVEDVGPVD
ncbi:MAG: signal peptidase I, partial [Anaerolineae bacterium]